ncbi:MAG: hypothetical protein IJ544_03935 [Prevotella sp.]|nr:hypothetical protein [Prevotella sp.]
MEERIRKEWQARNTLLQQAYRDSLLASKKKDKDIAYEKIKRELEWGPFEDLCYEHNADIYGISRYGLDSATEKCISIIDKIAKGEMDYNY